MDLTYITRRDRDENGWPFDKYFLVDTDSARAYGDIEAPSTGSQQIMFVVDHYKGCRRYYLTLEAAKGYLEGKAIEEDLEECQALTKTAFVEPEKEVEKEKVPE